MESEALAHGVTVDRNHIDEVARAILEVSVKGSSATASVIALVGEIGAGKTTTTQVLACLLGVTDDVTSPTFVILKNYGTTHPRFKTLTHIDAYRIEEVRELDVLGFEELCADPQRIIVIEWAERVASRIPRGAHWFHFVHVSDDVRQIRQTPGVPQI